MRYFVAGAWHFAAAMAFGVALGVLSAGEPTYWLRRPEFALPVLVSSSALFFIPDAWAKKGLLKYLHYPLADWDVLLLGPASHRHWLTHSPLVPLVLGALLLAWPLTEAASPLMGACLGMCRAALAGLALGTGSHLFWDCVSSRTHRIILVPHWLALPRLISRIYLLVGAAVCLGTALYASLPAGDQVSRTEAQRAAAVHTNRRSASGPISAKRRSIAPDSLVQVN